MFDARTFPNEIESAQKILEQNKAIFKGEYLIHDVIFRSIDKAQTLDKVFLRLRVVLLNIWNEKNVIVSIKNTEKKEVGKQSLIPLRKEFDDEVAARSYIDEHYSGQFEFDFEFQRKGWQYDFLNGDQVDLEEIANRYSIEFKSKTEEGLRQLITLFQVKKEHVIEGPSVVTIRELLTKNISQYF